MEMVCQMMSLENTSQRFLELHFLAARTWLESSEDNFLPVESIINLLNTMRVGANYLSYRRLVSLTLISK